ncbi:MAG: hypothetical protein ACFB6R_16745 [Alphaproteobacteria bacterium]
MSQVVSIGHAAALRKAGILLLCLVLGACTTAERAEPPLIRFSQGPIVRLEAERPVAVVDRYRAPLQAPHVEHEYRVVPAQIANAWIRDRIALSGTGGAVKLTIFDAGVVMEALPVSRGVFGWFRNEVDRRLTGTLEVQLDFVGVAGRAASTRATVSVTRGIRENADPEDVEGIYFDMIEALARGFDEEMSRQVREAFARATGAAA